MKMTDKEKQTQDALDAAEKLRQNLNAGELDITMLPVYKDFDQAMQALTVSGEMPDMPWAD